MDNVVLRQHDNNDDDNALQGRLGDDESAITSSPRHLPETPKEPMEFLSRSNWSLSAHQISKALSASTNNNRQMHDVIKEDNDTISLSSIPETLHVPRDRVAGKAMTRAVNGKTRSGAIRGWLFHHKECSNRDRIFGGVNERKNKDKARIENAHKHAVLSVAALAAALSTAAALTENSEGSGSKMNMAMASATQLLATYCIELAELAGADCTSVASVVRSAIGIHSANDLLTLTAAAATALRGEAALRARLPKEAKRSAAISPYEKDAAAVLGSQSSSAFHSEVEAEDDPPSVGDLLQLTQKGVLRWKHVSVYISKLCQVTIKLKSKHVGGAFSKNVKSSVYEVVDDESGRSWPFPKERENTQLYFGVKTGRGLLQFKCQNRVHKQKWVQGIEKLLQHSTSGYDNELLKMNKSI